MASSWPGYARIVSSITPLLPRNGAMPPVESPVAPAVEAAAAVPAKDLDWFCLRMVSKGFPYRLTYK